MCFPRTRELENECLVVYINDIYNFLADNWGVSSSSTKTVASYSQFIKETYFSFCTFQDLWSNVNIENSASQLPNPFLKWNTWLPNTSLYFCSILLWIILRNNLRECLTRLISKSLYDIALVFLERGINVNRNQWNCSSFLNVV